MNLLVGIFRFGCAITAPVGPSLVFAVGALSSDAPGAVEGMPAEDEQA